MSTTDTFDPSENEGLVELKRRWECGHFGLDAHGVYGIDEALNEAGEQLSLYDHPIEDKFADPVAGMLYNWAVSPSEVNGILNSMRFSQNKTCTICNHASRNSPCDSCYQMVRSAAMGEFIDQADSHPCFICDEGKIASQICTECMELFLGQ